MKQIKLTLFFFFLSLISFGQDSISVLWVGNSYIYVNDLPTMVSQLALSKGDKISFDLKTNGGFTFQSHYNDPTTFSKIESKPWDYVVLQAQSQEPSFPTGQVNSQTLPYATYLCDSVYENRYCSQPMFFMTWGRENGDPQWDSINTFYKMNERLRLAYLRFVDSTESSVSPVGSAWRYVRDNYPTIQLYSGDGSHPSVAGSYLAASTFYASLFRKSPVGASYISTLDPVTAQVLQEAAELTVLDSLDFFHLRSNSETAIAYFSFDQMDNTVQFQNESWRETEVSWNFGDGNFSNELNPLHEYTSNGIFTVDLIASNECGDDTISVQIEVSGVGLNDLMTGYKLKSLGEHQYVLEGMDQHSDVSIYELSGKEVALDITKKDKSSVEFDLSSLRTGMYILMNKELRIKLIR